jgi:hypothetical protein
MLGAVDRYYENWVRCKLKPSLMGNDYLNRAV